MTSRHGRERQSGVRPGTAWQVWEALDTKWEHVEVRMPHTQVMERVMDQSRTVASEGFPQEK